MSRVIICDRCGKTIEGARIGYIAWNWRVKSTEEMPAANRYEDKDFCESCMEEIMTFIDPPEPEEPKKQAAKNTGGARKKIDRGKVYALRNAGWTNKQIAEEMCCTQSCISNILAEGIP